jgi:hypothetical protein
LTGKTAMPPLDTLGHLGSTIYYGELPSDCDEAIYDYVDKCAEEGIPVANVVEKGAKTKTVYLPEGSIRVVSRSQAGVWERSF